jgi:hypothetical protein
LVALSEAGAETMIVYFRASCWERVSTTRAMLAFFWPTAT